MTMEEQKIAQAARKYLKPVVRYIGEVVLFAIFAVLGILLSGVMGFGRTETILVGMVLGGILYMIIE